MNVTLTKIDDVTAKLTVSVEENDYQTKVAAELKNIGRNHVIPGFRKGHIPFNELKRRFGRQVTSDVINREVYDAVVNISRTINSLSWANLCLSRSRKLDLCQQ